MRLLPTNSVLGTLEIVEIYIYYDGPRLFACRNKAQQIFLAIWMNDNEWLYVPVSPSRFQSVRSGAITLFEAIRHAEDKSVLEVKMSLEGQTLSVRDIPCEDLPADWLPDPGERLAYGDAKSNFLSSASQLERDSGREVFFIRLYENQPGRSEVPAKRLGPLLFTFQEALDALGQSIAGESTNRGPIPAGMLVATQMSLVSTEAGSFGLTLAASSIQSLFGNTVAADALDGFVSLIEIGSDIQKLTEQLVKLKTRAASKYRKFLREVVSTNTDLTIDWNSARPGRGRKARMPISTAVDALAAVEGIETKLSEQLQVECVLVGLNIRKRTYEINEVREQKKYSGRIADEAVSDVQHARINDRYTATLRENFETNPVTGEEKSKWELVALKQL
jgi:hypothetical protein